MLLILHIAIALSSLVYAAYVLFAPSNNGLRVTFGLIAATLLSGFSLLFMDPSQLPQICSTSLAYLAVMLAGVVFIRMRISNLNTVRAEI